VSAGTRRSATSVGRLRIPARSCVLALTNVSVKPGQAHRPRQGSWLVSMVRVPVMLLLFVKPLRRVQLEV
jgi:hypothetical protein